jgi:F-type H+-transporting ATPase subunit delta
MRADEGIVSRRYARAAMGFLEASGGHQAFADGLAKFAQALAEVPLLRTLLTTPVVKIDRKESVLKGVARALLLPEPLLRFLVLLVRKGRIEYVDGVAARFNEMLDARMSRTRATVTTPTPLGPLDRQAIATALGKKFGKQVLCTFAVDERLLGGVVARVGNTLMDSSIRGKLARLRKKVVSLSA